MINQHRIYIALFRALDCLYREHPNNTLRFFLSNANPYLLKDRCSADPSYLSDFLSYMKQHGTDERLSFQDAFLKVREYLKDNTAFSTRFDDISLSEWEALCAIINEECDEEGTCLDYDGI